MRLRLAGLIDRPVGLSIENETYIVDGADERIGDGADAVEGRGEDGSDAEKEVDAGGGNAPEVGVPGVRGTGGRKGVRDHEVDFVGGERVACGVVSGVAAFKVEGVVSLR